MYRMTIQCTGLQFQNTFKKMILQNYSRYHQNREFLLHIQKAGIEITHSPKM